MTLRGFAALSPDRRKEIAALGGKACAKVKAFDRKQVVLPGFERAKKARKPRGKKASP